MGFREKIYDLESNENVKKLIVFAYCIALILFGLVLGRNENIITGMYKIINSPDTLITDYILVGGHGAAFVNSGLLALSALYIAHRQRIIMTGATMAAVFTVAGFGLFGKNIFNVWPIIIGVWLYSLIKKDPFKNYILIALFGTALSPVVSEVAFALGLDPHIGIIAGVIAGILSGIILPPLSKYFVSIHQGYNLYNIGFTAGFIGTIFMSILRGFGLQIKGDMYWMEGLNKQYLLPLFLYFGSMIIIGLILSQSPLNKLKSILKKSGRIVTDFVIISGFGASLINMGIMGIIGIAYISLVSGDFNGPTIGALLTMTGFGAFGTHPKNALPVIFGVFIASSVSVWPVNAAGPLLAALFGTTLAPIAGGFGWISGIVAGALHLFIVMNVGYLHGGFNLYNNGFSGGIVATILLPILESLKEEK